jgi:transposase-like protein
MVSVCLHCPFCNTNKVTKNGTSNDKQRYLCHNKNCSRKTFYAEYAYNACKPDTKSKILKLAVEGNGIRSTSRILKVSKPTDIATIKKKKPR